MFSKKGGEFMKYLQINKEQFRKVGDVLYNESTTTRELLQSVKLANGDTLCLYAEKIAESDSVRMYWCNPQSVSK